MEQFVDAVKTSITNGHASTSLHNANFKDGDTKLLDNLHSLRSRMLLHQIHPEVVVGRPFMMVSVAVVFAEQVQGELKCCICQWCHQACAICCHR